MENCELQVRFYFLFSFESKRILFDTKKIERVEEIV